MYKKSLFSTLIMMILAFIYVIYYFFFIAAKDLESFKTDMNKNSNQATPSKFEQKREGIYWEIHKASQDKILTDTFYAKDSSLLILKMKEGFKFFETFKDLKIEFAELDYSTIVKADEGSFDYDEKKLLMPSACLSQFSFNNSLTATGSAQQLSYHLKNHILSMQSFSAFSKTGE